MHYRVVGGILLLLDFHTANTPRSAELVLQKNGAVTLCNSPASYVYPYLFSSGIKSLTNYQNIPVITERKETAQKIDRQYKVYPRGCVLSQNTHGNQDICHAHDRCQHHQHGTAEKHGDIF